MRNPPVKLLDRVSQRIRLKGYSIRTEKTYVSWIRQFILFHGKQHPRNMGKPEIKAFLSHLVMKRNVASSRQNQAFNMRSGTSLCVAGHPIILLSSTKYAFSIN